MPESHGLSELPPSDTAKWKRLKEPDAQDAVSDVTGTSLALQQAPLSALSSLSSAPSDVGEHDGQDSDVANIQDINEVIEVMGQMGAFKTATWEFTQ